MFRLVANFNNTLAYIVPSGMYKNSYVYARYANITRLRTDANLSGVHLDYAFPVNFLNKNKRAAALRHAYKALSAAPSEMKPAIEAFIKTLA